MTANLNKRFERMNQSCRSEENLGSLPCEADAQNKSDDGFIISLTSCYKHQWKVVFSEEQGVPTRYSSASAAPKTEKAMVACR
ncbi:MAG: hypothetical protein AB1589_21085 [Cyanobacteriota bacterium]